MLENYIPVLIFLSVGLFVGVIMIAMGGFMLAPRNPNEAKNSPYECGFSAFEDARLKFDVRFYLVAILFIIFDLEITFLFPWSIMLNYLGSFGFWSMMYFLFVLIIGFIFEWQKGALDW